MSEDELLSCVIECAILTRWRVYHIRNSKRGIVQGHTGFPDVVAVRDGRVLVAELKSAKGRLTAEQAEWLTDWRAAGALVFVWRPDDWLSGRIGEVLR
jgi:Holliday junction resolvase